GREGPRLVRGRDVVRSARGCVAVAGLLAACGAAPAGDPASRAAPDRELSGRILVRPIQESDWARRGLDPGAASARASIARQRLQGLELSTIDVLDIHVLSVPPGQDEASLDQLLMATGDYEFAQPDWLVHLCDTNPDDPGYSGQWHLQRIRAPLA